MTNSFSAQSIDKLTTSISALCVRWGLPPASPMVTPTGLWRISDGSPDCYELQFDLAGAMIELDRIAVPTTHRQRRLGSLVYFAFEDWVRNEGYSGIEADAQGNGACLTARVGFDFRDQQERDSFLATLKIHFTRMPNLPGPLLYLYQVIFGRGTQLSKLRYPYEVLALKPPIADGSQALRSISFHARRVFDEVAALEQISSVYRATLP